jgi:hypothetical protein
VIFVAIDGAESFIISASLFLAALFVDNSAIVPSRPQLILQIAGVKLCIVPFLQKEENNRGQLFGRQRQHHPHIRNGSWQFVHLLIPPFPSDVVPFCTLARYRTSFLEFTPNGLATFAD